MHELAVLLAIYVVLSVAGMVLVKLWLPVVQTAWGSGEGIVKPGILFLTGALLYILSFLVWMVILARSPLTIAYPIAVGSTMVLSTACAIFFLGETLSLKAVAGMVFVFLGIALLTG